MAKYLVLIYGDEQKYAALGEAGFADSLRDHNQFSQRNEAAILGGEALMDSGTATSIRTHDDGTQLVTDGPFAETKEILGGFYLVEAADLDAAIAIAKQVPAPFGGVEVRPVMSFEG